MADNSHHAAGDGQTVLVPDEGLKQLIVKVLERQGVFGVEADMAAGRMVEADLRGLHAHGSRALKTCVDAMDMGDIDARAQVLTMHETPAIAVLDAGKGLGHVAATRAMMMAIAKAKDVGTGTVGVFRSQQFGAASTYALLAAKEGMIGYCTTSAGGATVAAFGSHEPATANHGFAWGVPRSEGAPIILDMHCGVAAWEAVDRLRQAGQSLPAGWALDDGGRETADAEAAKTLRPAAEGCGYGLGMLCSVLTGPLMGRKMPIQKTRRPEIEGFEHFFYAIDVSQFVERERFDKLLEAAIDDIHALTPAEGFDRVQVPGEAEWELARRRRADGIPLPSEDAASLVDLATGMKVKIPW